MILRILSESISSSENNFSSRINISVSSRVIHVPVATVVSSGKDPVSTVVNIENDHLVGANVVSQDVLISCLSFVSETESFDSSPNVEIAIVSTVAEQERIEDSWSDCLAVDCFA